MLNPDYKEMLCLLKKHDVDFILIGAYALAYYGVPRSTGDIDFFIRPNIENSQRLYSALTEFGAPIQNIPKDYFSILGNILQIGVAPCRIDLINQIDGLEYDHTRYIVSDIDGISIKIISKDDFIKNKLATGRNKDLADIDSMNNGS